MNPGRFLKAMLAAFGCLACRRLLVQGDAAGPATRRGDGGPVIDIHTHWFPSEWVRLMEQEGAANGAKIGKNGRGAVAFDVPGITQTFPSVFVDLDVRLEAMNGQGVDMHALSLTNPMVYWAPPAFGLRLSQVYNDALVAAHQKHSRRFVGLAMLPMQAPALALQELNRVASLPGIRGVYMATHVNGTDLDDKSFFPVYARCEELGLPIFLHPVNPVGIERMRRFHLRTLLGNSYDTGIAAASLVFGGVMDAFPRLEVTLPHAGGTFPTLIGRMDHGAAVRPEFKHMKQPPSGYLRRFHYDTIGYEPSLIMYLVRLVGADRVMMGSDHPGEMSYVQPATVVEKLHDLSAAERDLILGGNASRLLKKS